jgi:hypothetical protein
MSMEELPIGKVILKKMTDSSVSALMSEIEQIIQSLQHTSEEKAKTLELGQRKIGDNIRNQVCAIFKVVAEPQQARIRAEEETRRVVDLLRFAIPVLYPKGLNVAIGLQGEVFRVNRLIPIFSTGGKSFNADEHIIGPLIPFEI